MRHSVKYGGIIAISLALMSGLTGCGGGMFAADKPETGDEILQGQDGKTLWEAQVGLQYVKIANQDKSGIPNEHPIILTSDEMRTVLSSIYVTETIRFKSVELPLFAIGETQVLSTTLASGLAQAQAGEDVTFVTIASHAGTFSDERKTNSGRVFMSGGRLNIIFGLIHEEYRKIDKQTGVEIDRRVHPLLPGSRKRDADSAVRIALDKGQSYYIDPDTGKERSDWLIIDIATVLKTAAERKAADHGDVSPELIEDVAQSKQDAGNLRMDVNNIEEMLFDMNAEMDKLQRKIEALEAAQP